MNKTIKIKAVHTYIPFIISAVVMLFFYGSSSFGHFWPELGAGWTLAFSHHLIDWQIKKKCTLQKGLKTIQFFFVSNFVKLAFFLIAIFCVFNWAPINQMAFVYAFFATYIVFLTTDLINMFQMEKVDEFRV